MLVPTLTIAFNHAVAVIAHVTKELDAEKYTEVGFLKRANFMAAQIFAVFFSLPGYNEFHSTPTLFSHNVDDQGMASHTWRTQNAKKNPKKTKKTIQRQLLF